MYCKNCGRLLDDNAAFCTTCGAKTQNEYSNDSPSFGFALLGFFFPIVGLILFLVFESKKPKRAKSVGKGALTGFIIKVVLTIILFILYITSMVALLGGIGDTTTDDIDDYLFEQQSEEGILENYADVAFGKFNIKNNGYYNTTSLNITVTNTADKQYTYYITIEACAADGSRLDTDIIYADRLNAGQSIKLTAFEYVDEEKLNDFKNATFKVLDIQQYSY